MRTKSKHLLACNQKHDDDKQNKMKIQSCTNIKQKPTLQKRHKTVKNTCTN